MLKLSKTAVSSFAGDVLSLFIEADAPIDCASEDASVCRLRRLGEGKYLLVLVSEGATELVARAGKESARVSVSVREARRSDPDGKFKIFIGDTHAHTSYSDGLANLVLSLFGAAPIDFIDGPYWAKMLVLCVYTVWIVMPFKILVLTGALASVRDDYYNAARIDGTSRTRIFFRITLPMISSMLFYLVITGFIGAFKAYSDAVAIFGTNLNAAEMNTIVGYIYDMLYGDSGGYPSFAAAAAIVLFVIVLTITCINLLIRRKHVYNG